MPSPKICNYTKNYYSAEHLYTGIIAHYFTCRHSKFSNSRYMYECISIDIRDDILLYSTRKVIVTSIFFLHLLNLYNTQ